MTPGEQVATLNPRDDVSEVFQKFMQRDVRQMPVMQDGSMVGVLRRQDLMRYLQLHSELGLHDARQTDSNGRA
jgi:predicted transcriptional regulator